MKMREILASRIQNVKRWISEKGSQNYLISYTAAATVTAKKRKIKLRDIAKNGLKAEGQNQSWLNGNLKSWNFHVISLTLEMRADIYGAPPTGQNTGFLTQLMTVIERQLCFRSTINNL